MEHTDSHLEYVSQTRSKEIKYYDCPECGNTDAESEGEYYA